MRRRRRTRREKSNSFDDFDTDYGWESNKGLLNHMLNHSPSFTSQGRWRRSRSVTNPFTTIHSCSSFHSPSFTFQDRWRRSRSVTNPFATILRRGGGGVVPLPPILTGTERK